MERYPQISKLLIFILVDCTKKAVNNSRMKIGYARCSTDEQNLKLQIDALQAEGCENIFEDEGVSGAIDPEKRQHLSRLLDQLQEGDEFIVWKLDRLGRSLSSLINLLGEFEKRGVEFKSLTDGIDTTTAGGKLVFHIMGALAEFERSLISERTKAGMAASKARGKKLGRPPTLTRAQVLHAQRAIQNDKETITSMASVFGVSRNTLARALKQN